MKIVFSETRLHQHRFWRQLAAVSVGVALITACAKVQIPFWPVPMTLHTLAVMTIAFAAGPRLATTTFCAYLIVGALGAPVFSGTPERGIGLAYMAGPTGGYLLGYMAGIWAAAIIALRRGFVARMLAMLAGLAITYAFGLPWLRFYVPADNILSLGFTPFILGDLISIAVVGISSSMVPPRFLGKLGQ